MKVSVCMVTYNHEAYIARALDSVLDQKTSFDYEIVIGEDCSTDNTRKILIDYQKKHPEKVKLILQNRNIGMHRNGAETIQACAGNYIAMLDGDDYWTSQYKLQKQVDLLDLHPESAICFHNVTEVYENQSIKSHPFSQKICTEDILFFTINDLLVHNFMPTPSIMFRNGLIGTIPDWFFDLPMGDWPLMILNAMHGSIVYINEEMAAHYNHDGSAWYKMTRNHLEARKKNIFVYETLYKNLDVQYRPLIANNMKHLCLQLAKECYLLGQHRDAKCYARMAIWKSKIVDLESANILVRIYLKKL